MSCADLRELTRAVDGNQWRGARTRQPGPGMAGVVAACERRGVRGCSAAHDRVAALGARSGSGQRAGRMIAGGRYLASTSSVGFRQSFDAPTASMLRHAMAVPLQAAMRSGKPILLRLESRAGHGYGFGTTNSQFNEELADCYAFLFWQLANDSVQSHKEATPTCGTSRN